MFYQQKHRSSFSLSLSLPPVILFSSLLPDTSEIGRSESVEPRRAERRLSRFRISAGFRTAATAAAEAAAARRTRRRYNRPAAPRSNRGARDLISRTRDALLRTRRSGRARKTERAATERTRACLPVCLAA